MSVAPVGKVLVFGGTGMVGRAVCRVLAESGVNVVSLSRSGAVGSAPSSQAGAWAQFVTHDSCDASDRGSVRAALARHAAGDESSSSTKVAVVHAIGSILPTESYKALVGKAQPSSAGGAAGRSASYLPGPDDLARVVAEVTSGRAVAAVEEGYQKLNAGTAENVAAELFRLSASRLRPREGAAEGEDEHARTDAGGAAAAGTTAEVGPCVLISADSAPPIIPPGYMRSKKAAEAAFLALPSGSVVRPGFIHSADVPATVTAARALSAGRSALASAGILAALPECLRGPEPVDAERVARAVGSVLSQSPETAPRVVTNEMIVQGLF